MKGVINVTATGTITLNQKKAAAGGTTTVKSGARMVLTKFN
jgi:hypothetical protein